MNYALLGIMFLTLILVVVSIWFSGHDTKLIYGKLTKNREADQIKQAQVEKLAKQILSATKLIEETQQTLDEQMGFVSALLDQHSTSLHGYLKTFENLAQSDILSARRDELTRTYELKSALERIMGMAMTSRQEPSTNDKLAMESVTHRIKELEKILETQEVG
jgi:hypothetical protein